ncbi:MAG: orotate phosphoribosyltransferase [Flammeovirgaceae bacterium]|nr:MAG: orotate phosphoribosyltransferase [Flammeovirgaceae bacterium]
MPILKVQHDTAAAIALQLLKIEAIKLNTEKPFTWASGIKSPIYCDNRVSLSYPPVRSLIKESLVNVIRENYPAVDSIAGVATAGIPQGALVADTLGLPFAYVRSSPKDHGLENLIEGRINPQQKIVVVEDLVSTGGSSLKAVEALRKAGAEVLGMVSIFTYGFDIAQSNFYNANVSLVSLSDFSHLLTVAVETGYITSNQLVSLKAWRFDPSGWK